MLTERKATVQDVEKTTFIVHIKMRSVVILFFLHNISKSKVYCYLNIYKVEILLNILTFERNTEEVTGQDGRVTADGTVHVCSQGNGDLPVSRKV
jgi:hypothetical protein